MNSLTQINAPFHGAKLIIGEISIRQDQDGRYCLNDLHKASGDMRKDRPSYFLENEKTLELIHAIKEENYDVGNSASSKQPINIIRGRGKEQGTYVVKELVYSYAMWISAKFHLTVIRAYDALVIQSKIKVEAQALPYPHEVIQVAQQINHEYNGGRYHSWFVHVRDDGQLSAMPLLKGYYPINLAEFSKKFDGLLEFVYGNELLTTGRYLAKK